MDHLSSCYFCGAAMDHPLQRYRVVPAELRDDDAVTTATLCPSCHSKLERLLAPVVEATGTEGVTLDATGEETGPEPEPEPEPESESAHAVPGDATDDPTDGDPRDERHETEVSPDADSTEQPADTESAGEQTTDAPAVDDPETDLLPESEIEGSEHIAEATDPNVPDELQSDESDRTDESEDANTEGAGATEETPNATESDDGGDEPRETAGRKEEPDADGTARTTVTALEYNKVMRLLQNREFPVERAEIETVAANAYGLARSECAAVIDLAIDRGLIAEEGSELVRPD